MADVAVSSRAPESLIPSCASEEIAGPSKEFRSSISAVQALQLLERLTSLVEPGGFEVRPFLTGWYDEVVDAPFRLPYPGDTFAAVIISAPSMFERTFLPHLAELDSDDMRDPLDRCMIHYFGRILQKLDRGDVDLIHDFELHPNRRPKILVQSAAHVSGAAFLYHPRNLVPTALVSAEFTKKKHMGVCLHPLYGGWFAIRGCLIFRNLACKELPRRSPVDVLQSPEAWISAIELFNLHWRDSRFRDVVPVKERYSLDQQRYFDTPPGQRASLLTELRSKHKA